MKSQKECVFQAIVELFGFESGVFKPSKSQLQEIYEIVAAELHEGKAFLKETSRVKYSTLESLRKDYVPGMVSNWIRKDERLNGGEKYVTKNPGSRAGSGDEQLKNLKALMSQHPEHADEIQVEIDKRIAELAAVSKKKVVTVDYDKIPADVRARLGL